MLIVDLKIFVFSFSFCYCITFALNHHRYQQQHEDSINWRQRFLTNNKELTTTTTTTTMPVASPNDFYLKNFKLRHHSRYPNLDRFESKIKSVKAPVTNNNNNNNNDNNKIRHDGGHFYKTAAINNDDDDVLSDDNGRSKVQRKSPVHYNHNNNNNNNNNNNKVRHNGRNSYRTLQTTSTTTTTAPPSTDADLFENYDDMLDDEDEDDDTEYDDVWDDDFDDDDEYEDDPFINDNNDGDDEWQAEEATETSQQQSISPFTKFKWDNYGSRARVEESRRQFYKANNNQQNDTLAVVAHYMKVNQQGQCRRPIPKVIPVQLLHPDPTKSYTPHCTILHRCAEDTGCCSNYETRCGPKKQVPVHLYFYAKTLGTGGTKVERLTFYNHTECACLEKNKLTTPPPPAPDSLKMNNENEQENENDGNSLDDYPSGVVTFRSGLQSDSLIRCRCPEEFTPKYRYDSRCSCDCDEHNQDCIRMKKGKEYFSLTDRKCIMENQCGLPVCEYGVYLRQTGRCQRKQEKIESHTQ